MKLSNKIHPGSSYEKHEVWKPSELGPEMSAPEKDLQEGRVLSFFSNEEENGVDAKGKSRHSVSHSKRTNPNFTLWQPEDIGSHPTTARKVDWNFIEISKTSSDPETQISNFFSGGAAQLEQFSPEKEAPLILERARAQAEEIILAAQAEADNVILQAQSEIDEQKKEGYQQGLKDARLELEDTLKAVSAMVGEVGEWKTNLMSQSENILVEMLKEISRKMFGDGIELDKNALQANLNRIMESANGLGSLNIFLNPKDARNLDSSWIDQYLLVSGGQAKIIPSDKITRGGCYVKGNMGTVDGRVETQFESFLKAFSEVSVLAE
jgi:flagellar assembly protein FliH